MLFRSGLIRYDGNTFERIEAVEGISNVRCLFVDSRERLWVGTNDSGVFLLEKGDIKNWNKNDGMQSSSVRSIMEDAQGMIYVASIEGVDVIDRDLQLQKTKDERIEGKLIKELRRGKDGLVYGVSGTGDLFVMKRGKVISYYSSEDYPFETAFTVLPDPENPGSLYIGTEHYVCHGSLKEDFDTWDKWDVSPLQSMECLEYIDGHIWICARTGIGKLKNEEVDLLQNIPMDNAFCHVMTDMDRNLWVASSRQGVMKIVPNTFTDLYAQYGLPPGIVNSTCVADGQLFIGADDGMIVIKDGKKRKSMPLTKAVTASGKEIEASDLLEYLDGIRIRSIIQDSRNRLWISTAWDRGLIRYDRGKIMQFTHEDGILSESIRTVSECEDGSMLVATNDGVNVIKGNQVIKGYGDKDGIDVPLILTVTEGFDHEILAGSDGGGIYIIGSDGMKQINADDGLTSDVIMRIKRSSNQDFYWIITGNSLAIMTSDHQVKTVRKFPYANNYDLFENSNGDLWLLGASGIYVIPSDKTLTDDGEEPLFLGIQNGLYDGATANSYSAMTEDGTLYMSSIEGVIKTNVNTSFDKVKEFRIVIPYMDGDDKRYFADKSGRFNLPSNVRKLNIYPYVIDFSLMDPKVSYYLKGFDEEKVVVNRSELQPVTYTNLSGGSYQFVIEISNPMGGENNEVSVPIFKQETFYDQVWFNIAAILVMLGILAILLTTYFRRKMRAAEKKHREEAERRRISEELTLAAQIQKGMLPSDFRAFSERSDFDIYASMTPAKEVGGDFYDFFLVDDDHLYMVIADVSGKGVPAALFMMGSKIILKYNAKMNSSPAQILKDTNDAICANNKQEMFVTVWIGILEISTGKLTACNAGHEYPVMKQPGGEFELIKDPHSFVVGGMENMTYKGYELMLSPGTKLFLYTDGLPEATDAENELYGTERMLKALNRESDADPRKLLKNISADVDLFVKEAEQFDDLTMFCLEYKG